MPKSVEYNDEIVAKVKDVAPDMEFHIFAQTAVREKIQQQRILNQKLNGVSE